MQALMQLIDERKQQWEIAAQQVADFRDKLGMPVDAGIFDTVVVLNALGIATTASCEGHLDHGQAAPWIRFQAKKDDPPRQRSQEATQKLEEARANQDKLAIEHWSGELFRLARDADASHFEAAQRLMDALEHFYAEHHVPYSRQLALRLDSLGNGTLTINGEPLQRLRSTEQRAHTGRVSRRDARVYHLS